MIEYEYKSAPRVNYMHPEYQLQTQLQWAKKGYVPISNDTGTRLYTNGFSQQCLMYYRKDEVRLATQAEAEEFKQQQRNKAKHYRKTAIERRINEELECQKYILDRDWQEKLNKLQRENETARLCIHLEKGLEKLVYIDVEGNTLMYLAPANIQLGDIVQVPYGWHNYVVEGSVVKFFELLTLEQLDEFAKAEDWFPLKLKRIITK